MWFSLSDYVLLFFPFAIPVCYALEALVAYPMHRYLRDRHKTGIFSYLGIGVVAGLVPAIISLLEKDPTRAVKWVGLGVPCGVLSAAIFWVIARPDKRADD